MYRTNSKKKLKKYRKDSMSSSNQSSINYKKDCKKTKQDISKLSTEEIFLFNRNKHRMEPFESWHFCQLLTDKILNRTTRLFYSRQIEAKVKPHNAEFLNELFYSIFLLSNINNDKGEHALNSDKFKHEWKPSLIVSSNSNDPCLTGLAKFEERDEIYNLSDISEKNQLHSSINLSTGIPNILGFKKMSSLKIKARQNESSQKVLQLNLSNNVDNISENDQMRINHEKSEAKRKLLMAEEERKNNDLKKFLEEKKIIHQKMLNSVVTHDDNGGIIFVRNLNLDTLPILSTVCNYGLDLTNENHEIISKKDKLFKSQVNISTLIEKEIEKNESQKTTKGRWEEIPNPSNFEIFAPNSGVTVMENGKSKSSVSYSSKIGKQTRKEFMEIIKNKRISRINSQISINSNSFLPPIVKNEESRIHPKVLPLNYKNIPLLSSNEVKPIDTKKSLNELSEISLQNQNLIAELYTPIFSKNRLSRSTISLRNPLENGMISLKKTYRNDNYCMESRQTISKLEKERIQGKRMVLENNKINTINFLSSFPCDNTRKQKRLKPLIEPHSKGLLSNVFYI